MLCWSFTTLIIVKSYVKSISSRNNGTLNILAKHWMVGSVGEVMQFAITLDIGQPLLPLQKNQRLPLYQEEIF